MTRPTARTPLLLATLIALVAALLVPVDKPAHAYSPTSGVVYQLPSSQPCLKGRGNCAIYPKAVQLPSGRLLASFELATVAASGSAAGETLPIYKSDDDGTSWQLLSQVKAPAYLSSDPAYSAYTSNWGNPFFYVLPQAIGGLAAGTLVMASVVTGDDSYYLEHKAANPSWTPTNDGDRSHMALALFTSRDQGVSWSVLNIITTGGWQGGSAGAIGTNVANANTYREVDPVWEPYLMSYNGQLVAYYSDENDFTGYNTTTGVPTLAADNATAADGDGQILAHRTWDGTSASWSNATLDVSGTTFTTSAGESVIGGGRPGMANVVQTSDGKWLLTYEYWGGGDNVRYKISSSPLNFFSVGGATGTGISSLAVTSGSHALSQGGSPVLLRMPDGRILFNASGSGDVWMNPSGSSTGPWTEYQTTVPAGYSRNLTYVQGTGRVAILGNTGVSTIVYADVDFGHSAAPYYRIVNRLTGQVIGTGNHTNDADLGNGDTPDVQLEAPGSAPNADTEAWHVTAKANGAVTLLNKSGGRAAGIWTANATAGQRIGQWVDDTTAGLWNLVPTSGGYFRLQSAANTGLSLTGASAGAPLTLQANATDGSQEWQLVQLSGYGGTHTVVGTGSSRCVDVPQHSTTPSTQVQLYDCNLGANQKWTFNADGTVVGVESGLCLDVRGASTTNGAAVQTYTCTGAANQKWTAEPDGTLVGVQSGLCLDAAANATANGTLLEIWACNAGANQKWSMG